jgi:hypothetical protein
MDRSDAGGSGARTSSATAASDSGLDSAVVVDEARWVEAERNMDSLGVTVALLTKVLDGAVYLDSDAHEDEVSRKELQAALLAQEKRIQQLQTDLAAARAAQKEGERKLRETSTELVNSKVALQAHVSELLAAKEELARRQ